MTRGGRGAGEGGALLECSILGAQGAEGRRGVLGISICPLVPTSLGLALPAPTPLQLGSLQKPPESTCLRPLLAFDDSGREK